MRGDLRSLIERGLQRVLLVLRRADCAFVVSCMLLVFWVMSEGVQRFNLGVHVRDWL